MPEKIRSFIAIELSKEIHEELSKIIDGLKSIKGNIRWMKPGNIHLTLKFLGGLSSEEIETVKRVMDEAVSDFKGFELSLGGLGGFPRLEHPRVIWIGIEKGGEESENLNKKIEASLVKEGFEREERQFHPHLTLGRVKQIKDKSGFKKSIEQIKDGSHLSVSRSLGGESAKMDVTHLTLFQSTLTPKGSIYTPLHTA